MADWTWAAAAATGTSHIADASPRQDAFRVVARSGVLIAVAADGAGSALHGRSGAMLAARLLTSRATSWVERHGAVPSPALVELWVAEARFAILLVAERHGHPPSVFATTLVLAISDGEATLTAQIGDGAVVARAADSDDHIALSWPHAGEYAATTFFMTDPVPALRIGVITHRPLDRLALFTDGVERLALDFAACTPHQPFFRGMFTPLAATDASAGSRRALSTSLKDFLSSHVVGERTDDDKTLVLAAFR